MPVLDALEGEGSTLRSMKELEGYAIRATDGTIGHVRDFYFDESWVIRYFIVDTGAWLWSRKVLISPIAIGHPNWSERALFRLAHEGAGQGRPRHRHRTAGLETT